MIDSKKLYLMMEAAHQDVKQQLADVGIKTFMVFIVGHARNSPEIKLQAGEYNAQEEVNGKDMQELVDEVIRRHTFRLRQNTLQLSPPVVETTCEEVVTYTPPETSLSLHLLHSATKPLMTRYPSDGYVGLLEN